MLFRTVYGPELEAVYQYIVECSQGETRPTKKEIRRVFLRDGEGSPQSVDDALTFLTSSGLVAQHESHFIPRENASRSFRVKLLSNLRRLELGECTPEHSLDPLYLMLLTQLFVEPDILFVEDVHAAANQLQAVEERGGLSQEKIGAWKRVMVFLGLGHRVSKGFLCSYEPTLLEEVLRDWGSKRGTLQDFLENQLGQLLPYAQVNGNLSQSVSQSLLYLQDRERLTLFPMQDSPTRAYLGAHRYKGLAWGGEHA